MKQQITKLFFIFSIAIVVVIGSGCGAKGDLYFPEEPQTTDK